MIRLKTEQEIEKMRIAGRAVAAVLEEAKKIVVEGATAYDIEMMAEKVIKEHRCEPAFKGYGGYPYITTVSVNEEVIHGFPLKSKVFKKGDIVSVDVGAIYEGYYGDGAATFIVGSTDETGKKLVEVTKQSLTRAIELIKPGVRLGDVSYEIQSYVESHGFNVVRDFVGHGVGKQLHEDPQVPNYGKPGTGLVLKAGMTLAIEPMVTEGGWHVVVLEDGWTVVTVDGKRAAHFEHTIVVTENGCEILTTL
ncbi:type I methionyl aminopeptidase [Fervidobacterium pennivorans subsp. shakshaketiis]|jgi:methionyl aminopeptidase|uniref:Methionine aminopeptidase n=1 Tax=Fervidobacterium pennivorans (strain DSM 9078 / Ven5) TaxID=771875 RepID=H9UD75_FERPD|nr:type I methionyl aminopeptidase [Fervidobacterium pennivorans]AFG35468.1 methionine aminopeptidase, type I [Fervidobacterium pennivorans DSM 9078]QIV78895.1 type I methionyl aminopeptidase [Fervidobacterium pennivorans subsp. keratinolyticus]